MLISVTSSSNHKLYVQREQFPYKDLHMSEKNSSGTTPSPVYSVAIYNDLFIYE